MQESLGNRQPINSPDKVSGLSTSDYLSLEESRNGGLDSSVLQEFLRAVLSQEEQQARNQARHVIDAIGQPQRLSKILDSILADPKKLEQIALKSFGHSTGMERIELASDGQCSLRLHFWMPGKGESFTEDPHDHTYNFSSKVLSGVLVTDLFTQGDEGVNMDMFKIDSQNTQQKPTPKLIGDTKLQLISPPQGIFLSEHDPAYTMSHNTVHRVRQGSQQKPIITLNLRGVAVKGQSNFFRDKEMHVADPTPTQIDIESRLSLLRHIITNA